MSSEDDELDSSTDVYNPSIRINQKISIPEEDPVSAFQIGQILGSGSFGEVHEALHKKSKTKVAIKTLFVGADAVDEIKGEVGVLRILKHPNIVQYHGTFLSTDREKLVMDLADMGSLHQIMIIDDAVLTEPIISAIIKQVCQALSYLHTQANVVHRDIKSDNILLCKDGSTKLTDFGVSKAVSRINKAKTLVGTPYWMAPEVISSSSSYTFSADIWSLGISIIEMAEGVPPHSKLHPMKALMKIVKSPPPTFQDPSNFSKELVDFVTLCLQKDPNDRPTAKKLLGHPFLTTHPKRAKRELKSYLKRIRKKMHDLEKAEKERRKKAEMLKHAKNLAGEDSDDDNDEEFPVDFDAETIIMRSSTPLPEEQGETINIPSISGDTVIVSSSTTNTTSSAISNIGREDTPVVRRGTGRFESIEDVNKPAASHGQVFIPETSSNAKAKGFRKKSLFQMGQTVGSLIDPDDSELDGLESTISKPLQRPTSLLDSLEDDGFQIYSDTDSDIDVESVNVDQLLAGFTPPTNSDPNPFNTFGEADFEALNSSSPLLPPKKPHTKVSFGSTSSTFDNIDSTATDPGNNSPSPTDSSTPKSRARGDLQKSDPQTLPSVNTQNTKQMNSSTQTNNKSETKTNIPTKTTDTSSYTDDTIHRRKNANNKTPPPKYDSGSQKNDTGSIHKGEYTDPENLTQTKSSIDGFTTSNNVHIDTQEDESFLNTYIFPIFGLAIIIGATIFKFANITGIFTHMFHNDNDEEPPLSNVSQPSSSIRKSLHRTH